MSLSSRERKHVVRNTDEGFFSRRTLDYSNKCVDSIENSPKTGKSTIRRYNYPFSDGGESKL